MPGLFDGPTIESGGDHAKRRASDNFSMRDRFPDGTESDRLDSSHRHPPDPKPRLPVSRPGTASCLAASEGNDETRA
jgi:hypothetical protein